MPSPEYYLWYEAACCELDMNIRAGLLSKALTIMRKEEFIGGVRLAMADTLLRLQKPEATGPRGKEIYCQTGGARGAGIPHSIFCSQMNQRALESDRV